MTMRKFTILLLALMSLFTAKAEDITVNGTKRNYLVYAPKNLGAKRPLLISCHGMNQDAPYQKNMLQIESVADTAKFVTVFPNGIDKSWDLGGDKDLNFMTCIQQEIFRIYYDMVKENNLTDVPHIFTFDREDTTWMNRIGIRLSFRDSIAAL